MSTPALTRILDAYEKWAVYVSDLIGDITRLLVLWTVRVLPVLLLFYFLFDGKTIIKMLLSPL